MSNERERSNQKRRKRAFPPKYKNLYVLSYQQRAELIALAERARAKEAALQEEDDIKLLRYGKHLYEQGKIQDFGGYVQTPDSQFENLLRRSIDEEYE